MPRIPMSRTLVAALLAVGFTTAAHAQRRYSSASSGDAGGRGFFMIGAEYMDLDELNTVLAQHNYPQFDDYFLTLGGGGLAVRNNFVLGGEGHALLQSAKTQAGEQFRTSVMGGYGMFDAGYQVVHTRHVAIYPLLGIGGGGITLSIRQRATLDFNDVLVDPGRGVQLTNGELLVGGALGADWLISSGNRGGFMLGLRAGYNYAPLEADWRFGENNVAGGPQSGLTGAYVRVSIGGGRR